MKPDRDWSLATAKLDAEDWICRGCGKRVRRLERAHVIGRKHDFDPPVYPSVPAIAIGAGDVIRWKPGLVWPDRILPLCGPPTDPTTCHGKQHAGRLDVLRLLSVREQTQACADAGGIDRARGLLLPGSRLPPAPRDPDVLGGLG